MNTDKVKVRYYADTGIVKGYYPASINYNNIDTEAKTIGGYPYIEITEEEQKQWAGKKVKVKDGKLVELTEEENQARIKAINDEIKSKYTYIENRKVEYGSLEKQIEYITENGLEAWQLKVGEIKAKYPKENVK